MKNVLVFLADGFEEIEAITTVDLLRRSGLCVQTVAVGKSLEVSGVHHVPVIADRHISQVDASSVDAYVLPGGLPGVTNLASSEPLLELIREAYDAKRLVAAICAAPTILGKLGLLDGRPATCYPGCEGELGGYLPTGGAPVAVSDHVITGRSAGVALEFALEVIAYLLGREAADRVAQAIIIG